jgi:HK97 family phage portal protein
MSELTLLNLEQPERPAMRADYESSAATGISLSDVESLEQFLIGVRTHTGQIVTPERAKRCSVVLAILRGLSEDISALDIGVFRRGENGETQIYDHPVHQVLSVAPNALMTPMELREHIFYDLVLQGNFYCLINEDPNSPGDIGSLWPLQAQYVVRRWRQAVWTFTDEVTGQVGEFTPDAVWRGSILSGNGIDGMAITLLAREAIGILLAAEEQAARLFKQGLQTDMTLTSPETLDAEAKGQLRAAIMARHAGSGNAWMPLLLEGGLTAKRIGLTAQESQYMESRGFQISDIARIFRYPEVLLGSTGKSSKSATYASAEQFFQSYTKHTLGPWATRIEQTIQRDLFTSKERKKLFVKHNFDSLLKGDTAARYASYATGVSIGFMSPAEVRRKENMPYVPGLDYFTKPMNMEATAGADAQATNPTDVSGMKPRAASKALTEAGVRVLNSGTREVFYPNEPKALPAPAADRAVAMVDKLARRSATSILRKEHKALTSARQDPNNFYSTFGGYITAVTGAEGPEVIAYLESRRTAADRFSTEAQETAIADLITLCTKE